MSTNHFIINAFGDALSAIRKEGFNDALWSTWFGVDDDNAYYRPPIEPKHLAKLLKANGQHGTLATFKANMAVKYMEDNPLISREVLYQVAYDYDYAGNGCFQLEKNEHDVVVGVKHSPFINTRRMRKGNNRYGWLLPDNKIKKFKEGEIVHLKDYDPTQQIYGVPYWIGCLQSILLGEDVRIFPRAFFGNGAHTGKFIATSNMAPSDKESFEKQVKGTTKRGAFKTVFAHLLKGKIDEAFKVFNMSEHTERIDFSKLADLCTKDIMQSRRVRPELSGMYAENVGGSGDLDKIRKMNHENEVVPNQLMLQQINAYLPQHAQLRFKPFESEGSA